MHAERVRTMPSARAKRATAFQLHKGVVISPYEDKRKVHKWCASLDAVPLHLSSRGFGGLSEVHTGWGNTVVCSHQVPASEAASAGTFLLTEGAKQREQVVWIGIAR